VSSLPLSQTSPLLPPFQLTRAQLSLPFVARSSEEETRLTLLLEKAIRKSEAVDRESLCIVAGEKVRPSRDETRRDFEEGELELTRLLLSFAFLGSVVGPSPSYNDSPSFGLWEPVGLCDDGRDGWSEELQKVGVGG